MFECVCRVRQYDFLWESVPVTDDALRNGMATNIELGFDLAGTTVESVAYADDVVLFAESPLRLRSDGLANGLSLPGMVLNSANCTSFYVQALGKEKSACLRPCENVNQLCDRLHSDKEAFQSREISSAIKRYLFLLPTSLLNADAFASVIAEDLGWTLWTPAGLGLKVWRLRHVMSVSPPDENIGQQLTAPRPRVHPRGLLPFICLAEVGGRSIQNAVRASQLSDAEVSAVAGDPVYVYYVHDLAANTHRQFDRRSPTMSPVITLLNMTASDREPKKFQKSQVLNYARNPKRIISAQFCHICIQVDGDISFDRGGMREKILPCNISPRRRRVASVPYFQM
ncbi:unnamed protein product [Schistocephalus solidus]|uniref:Reverse transcriptase domain-containing protein n=1 Tax=Schistocephalus solidus TaxID=70667 RepID=A0A183SSC3_SCHSO|nr:unnamed protein product [Schistocephalus solidus]